MQNNAKTAFTRHHTLRGHEGIVRSAAWSPDGRVLASGSDDKTIRLWNSPTGDHLRTLKGHTSGVTGVAWSPDGNMLASSSDDKTTRLWNLQTGEHLRILKGHTDWVRGIVWSPDGMILASGSQDKTIRLWNPQTGEHLRTLKGHTTEIFCLAWSPDGSILASGSECGTIRLWNPQTGEHLRTLKGHTDAVTCVSWSPDGMVLASGSHDKTIRLWNPLDDRLIHTLEGHTKWIAGISFSRKYPFFTSISKDRTIRIWNTDLWETSVVLKESLEVSWPTGFAFHPDAPILVSVGTEYKSIIIWDLAIETILNATASRPTIHYTTAKIALVGDSGVGKTGLGYRIAEGNFRATESTHGQQFWVIDDLGQTRADSTQCEAVLWDFAGQPNFRPIHALFLDNIDLALVLFDPSRPDTFKSVEYWLKQLSHKQRLCHTILVVARTDVSKLSHSLTELETFCYQRNISGGFIMTSAKTGDGVGDLLERITQQIDWNTKTTTVTTETFKRIKDFVLALKVDTERKDVLVSRFQLRRLLAATDPKWQFTDAEMMTAVGHLQNHGYVTILRRSSEEESILLTPDLLINLAASYMLKAQSNERGLGALDEVRALRNEYRFPEVQGLSGDERDTLLNAVTELFLTRNVCFRESVDNQTFLIFPSLIQEQPPQLLGDAKQVEDLTYIVEGQIENVYPALVVLLGYAPSFQRINQWRKQAQYETAERYICGFKLTNDDPKEIELVLYYGQDTPDYVRLRFQGLFEEILYKRNVTVRKYPVVVCPLCGRQQERRTVIRRIQRDQKWLFCEDDGEKMSLPKATERLALSSQDRAAVAHDQTLSNMRTTYETALVRVKGHIRGRNDAKVTCFVSYAWGNSEHERWVRKLTDDLRKADIDVVLDQYNNAALGSSVTRFISRIAEDNFDFVLVIGTPTYQQKYENKLSQYGSVVAAEVDLINVRLTGSEAQKASVIPLLLDGEEHTAFPPLLHRRVYGDFTQEKMYFVTLFDLVLTLYRISLDDPIVRDLREKLRGEV